MKSYCFKRVVCTVLAGTQLAFATPSFASHELKFNDGRAGISQSIKRIKEKIEPEGMIMAANITTKKQESEQKRRVR